jgi:hypothetical protein
MRVIVLIAAFVFSGATSAGTLPDLGAAKNLVNQVMKQASSGDLRGGFETAKKYTSAPDAEFEAMLGQAELQMPVMVSRFGKSYGYEVLRTDTVGESLVRVLALQKFEKHPTVWSFVFYRGQNGWLLDSIKYGDDPSIAFGG